MESEYNFTKEEWQSCLKVLDILKDNPFENPDNRRFGTLVTKIHKKARKINRTQTYSTKKASDLGILKESEISKNALANHTVYEEGNEKKEQRFSQLNIPKNCYCCNTSYMWAHSFYNRLCPTCADINYRNRFKRVDLTNRNVILTGGRVKIGYATALKVLRSNANLTVTTRFPASALSQFKEEKDYDVWKERLTVYGLDLRNLKAVETFVMFYKEEHGALDILINNAAQTIKYTTDYYTPLILKEQQTLEQLKHNPYLIENSTQVIENVPVLTDAQHNRYYAVNRFGQPMDNRTKTSWNSTLEEVDMNELLEVNLINQISPYYLIKEFTPLFRASEFEKKFIVNVTSSEGQFSYSNKSIFHPHTNMTKAALNMLTRTSASEYEAYGIYMNAIDVGWVSTGAQEELRQKQFEEGYIPPLDPVDGASRILVPIAEALEDKSNPVGKLIKNYVIEEW